MVKISGSLHGLPLTVYSNPIRSEGSYHAVEWGFTNSLISLSRRTAIPITHVITRPTETTVLSVRIKFEIEGPYFNVSALEKLIPIR